MVWGVIARLAGGRFAPIPVVAQMQPTIGVTKVPPAAPLPPRLPQLGRAVMGCDQGLPGLPG